MLRWIAPKPIPDKASHPNFPHIQSIEYEEHADQPGHAAKHSKNRQKKRKMRNVRTASARKNGKNNKSGRVALSGLALGDMDPYKVETAHFAAQRRGPENRKYEVKLRPLLCRPLKRSMSLFQSPVDPKLTN